MPGAGLASARILAVALVGLAAWVISDLAAGSDTAISSEVETLVNEYLAAWNSYNEEALLAVVTRYYVLRMTGGQVPMSQGATESRELFETLEGEEIGSKLASVSP